MSESVATTITSKITSVHTLGDAAVGTADKTVTRNWLDTVSALTGTTTIPVTTPAGGNITLTGGAATIDLRAVLGTNGVAVDGNGKKVQAIKFKNPSTNANSITIVQGASNGYGLFGATFGVTLAPGQSILAELADAAPDIGASAKTIDVTGTGSQVLQVELVMG